MGDYDSFRLSISLYTHTSSSVFIWEFMRRQLAICRPKTFWTVSPFIDARLFIPYEHTLVGQGTVSATVPYMLCHSRKWQTAFSDIPHHHLPMLCLILVVQIMGVPRHWKILRRIPHLFLHPGMTMKYWTQTHETSVTMVLFCLSELICRPTFFFPVIFTSRQPYSSEPYNH